MLSGLQSNYLSSQKKRNLVGFQIRHGKDIQINTVLGGEDVCGLWICTQNLISRQLRSNKYASLGGHLKNMIEEYPG